MKLKLKNVFKNYFAVILLLFSLSIYLIDQKIEQNQMLKLQTSNRILSFPVNQIESIDFEYFQPLNITWSLKYENASWLLYNPNKHLAYQEKVLDLLADLQNELFLETIDLQDKKLEDFGLGKNAKLQFKVNTANASETISISSFTAAENKVYANFSRLPSKIVLLSENWQALKNIKSSDFKDRFLLRVSLYDVNRIVISNGDTKFKLFESQDEKLILGPVDDKHAQLVFENENQMMQESSSQGSEQEIDEETQNNKNKAWLAQLQDNNKQLAVSFLTMNQFFIQLKDAVFVDELTHLSLNKVEKKLLQSNKFEFFDANSKLIFSMQFLSKEDYFIVKTNLHANLLKLSSQSFDFSKWNFLDFIGRSSAWRFNFIDANTIEYMCSGQYKRIEKQDSQFVVYFSPEDYKKKSNSKVLSLSQVLSFQAQIQALSLEQISLDEKIYKELLLPNWNPENESFEALTNPKHCYLSATLSSSNIQDKTNTSLKPGFYAIWLPNLNKDKASVVRTNLFDLVFTLDHNKIDQSLNLLN